MPHQLTWEAKGVYWKHSGKVTGAEIIETSTVIYGDPRFDDLRYKLVDFSDIESIDIDEQDIIEIACLHRAAGLSNPRIKNAILISANTSKLANQFAAFFDDSPWDIQIFKEIDKANNWLERKPA